MYPDLHRRHKLYDDQTIQGKQKLVVEDSASRQRQV